MTTTTTTPPVLATSTSEIALAEARFIDLITFRRTGEPVGTPVLFVLDADRLLVRTAAASGKLKRLRHTARVELAPSDQRGRHLGPTVQATARILGPDAVRLTLARLHARYRIAGPLFSLVRRVRGQADVIIEIQLPATATGRVAPSAMSGARPTRGTLAAAALAIALAGLVGACGSAAADMGAAAPDQPTAVAVAEAVADVPATSAEPVTTPAVAGPLSGAELCAVVAQGEVEQVLGQPVTDLVAKDQGLMNGASCRYVTADSAVRLAIWFDSETDRADWDATMQKVGMAQGTPVDGIGDAAFRTSRSGTSPKTKLAVFEGGQDVWIDIVGPPDVAAASAAADEFARAILAAAR